VRKVALVFVLAVLAPSLVLAWLALRSLRDQQFLLERQQSLLYQGVTDSLAKQATDYIGDRQREFNSLVEEFASGKNPRAVAPQFDQQIRSNLSLAEVGFCVTLSGNLLCPDYASCVSVPKLREFSLDNSAFLGNKETVEVYWNSGAIYGKAGMNSGGNASNYQSQAVNNSNWQPQQRQEISVAQNGGINNYVPSQAQQPAQQANVTKSQFTENQFAINVTNAKSFSRSVYPQKNIYKEPVANAAAKQQDANPSRIAPAEAEFGQLIGDATDGILARYLQNKLKLMFWHRLTRDPDLVFGVQLNLNQVVNGLREVVKTDPELHDEICVALLDDTAKPVILSRPGFQAGWKRPFVATEIGESLPHWEIAAYLVNPEHLTQVARTARLTLGLLIATLVLAIGIGGWLIVTDLNRELALARQKTDFVSNVSHELKTPLTSIRMFSELLADQRVADPAKQRSYLNIITAETARLTRLINNVLDFSRMERGEKKYDFRDANLVSIVRETAETYRPHLENSGFQLDEVFTAGELPVRVDTDAIAQIIVNLLSNAEKYSNGEKKISIEVARRDGPLPWAEVKVLDRGPGVPHGSEEKIFEKFYRAHDSLGSGIQGSGLGLTLARQIARAHGGDVIYEPREGGGSCFFLRLPLNLRTSAKPPGTL
jgi:signal transduction histidine kinase